jgi:phospholipase C
MKSSQSLLSAMTAMIPLLGSAIATSLADIDHVVLFMQENRAFDHYFGTLAGVRGFMDPNAQINGIRTAFQQRTDADLNTTAPYLNPWYVNYLGGDWNDATQCMAAGSNGWEENHAAYNFGLNDAWATNNTPWSWSHFRRSDIPLQFAVADGWTVGDMYQESVISSTNPNRVSWVSGTNNVPGSPQSKEEGGYPYIDNNETPGCDDLGINCYPLKWKTAGEIYQDKGISWQVFQDDDNYDDNPYAWYEQFQEAANGSELHTRGMAGQPLNDFYSQAASGTLPAISYIVGPAELSEHPPYSPRDGAWLQKKVIDAVTHSPAYARTVLIISYDGTGGFGDHVPPYHSPKGTAGEWLEDPYTGLGNTFNGPGFRLPFYIISPFTRGGSVFTEHADHSSQIMFIEEWQRAKGVDVVTPEMVPWRREHMSNLLAAFDFDRPDYSVPTLPDAPMPHTDSNGKYDGSAVCQAKHKVTRPPVPYEGEGAVKDVASLSELGSKQVRGYLTEGRWLTFEAGGKALTNIGSGGSYHMLGTSSATAAHEKKAQRFVIHAVEIGGSKFKISSALDGAWVTASGTGLTTDMKSAEIFDLKFEPSKGHVIMTKDGKYIGLGAGCRVSPYQDVQYWTVFSVTYNN